MVMNAGSPRDGRSALEDLCTCTGMRQRLDTYVRVLSLLLVCSLVSVVRLIKISIGFVSFAIHRVTSTHKDGLCSRGRHPPSVQLFILDLCQCLHHPYILGFAMVPNRVIWLLI